MSSALRLEASCITLRQRWASSNKVYLNTACSTLSTLHSDGTLSPAGVRFGSAEIYNIGTSMFGRP